MHAQHRDAGIDGVNVPVGHEHGDGAAAALVHLAQLAQLPDHFLLRKEPAQIGHQLGRRVTGAGLAPGAGELADAHAVVDLGLAALLGHIGVQGIVGVADVGREAEALFIAAAQGHTLALAQILHEAVKGGALHTADAVGAGLLLVGQDADAGALRVLHVEDGLQLRIGADPVVMAVAADEGAVKTHLAHVKSGDGGQLRGEEVLLGNVIHIVENAKHRQLHPVLALVGIGGGADEDVQALAGDALGHGLLHLVGSQVGQQVGNDELRFIRFPADADVDHVAVFQGHNAVQLQRNGDPLVLLDAAIVVGAEKAHLIGLIHGDLLQVKPGRIHMSAGDHRALAQVLAADDGQHQGLAPVVAV